MTGKTLLSVAIFGALLLNGCGGGSTGGSSDLVKSKIKKPTGSLQKLETYAEKNSSVKQSVQKISGIEADKILKKLGLNKLQNNKMMRLPSGDVPQCINDDNFNVSEDDSSIKGTLLFDHCDFDGIKINGKITVDFKVNEIDNGRKTNYNGSIANLDFSYQDIHIHIEEAKAKGSSTWKFDSENDTESGKETHSFGIKAYLTQGNSDKDKLLILDGFNGDYKKSFFSSSLDEKYERKEEFSVKGFIGSTPTGMFKVSTPKRVKISEKYKCPNEGKITLTDKDGKILKIIPNERKDKIIISDGEGWEEEYPCN